MIKLTVDETSTDLEIQNWFGACVRDARKSGNKNAAQDCQKMVESIGVKKAQQTPVPQQMPPTTPMGMP